MPHHTHQATKGGAKKKGGTVSGRKGYVSNSGDALNALFIPKAVLDAAGSQSKMVRRDLERARSRYSKIYQRWYPVLTLCLDVIVMF